MLKKATILISALLLSFLFTSIAYSSGDSDKLKSELKDTLGQDVPIISFPEPEFNFGNIPQKAERTHIFKVRNTGKAPLKLINAKAS
jgi:archaellum component FlaG (FlaF/FlaG flagellin family)